MMVVSRRRRRCGRPSLDGRRRRNASGIDVAVRAVMHVVGAARHLRGHGRRARRVFDRRRRGRVQGVRLQHAPLTRMPGRRFLGRAARGEPRQRNDADEEPEPVGTHARHSLFLLTVTVAGGRARMRLAVAA
jgi:hypothetical protein